jgi:hypothetical protein
MQPRRRRSASRQSPLRQFFSTLFVAKSVRQFWGPVAFLSFLFLALGIACFYFKEDILNQREYIVPRERIRVANPPPWLTSDFVTEVLRLLPAEYRDKNQASDSDDNGLELALNANDPPLVDNLRIAFLKHPLVERVREIYIYYPPTIDVKLDFRMPLALVDSDSELLEEFQSDIAKYFPDDSRFFKTRPSLSAALQPEPIEQENVPVRYIIDKTGRRLPNAYFAGKQEIYARLPRIAGLFSSNASAGDDPILEEAGAFARFLNEANATEDWQIVKIGVLRVYGAKRGLWFFKTSGNAVVKWGRFAPRIKTTTNPRNDPSEWSELYNFQYRKLVELRERILDNDEMIRALRASHDPQERANAEKKRLKVYDVSSVLLGEEDETSGE